MTLPCESWRRYQERLGRSESSKGKTKTHTSVTTLLGRSNIEMRRYRCMHFSMCLWVQYEEENISRRTLLGNYTRVLDLLLEYVVEVDLLVLGTV